MEKLPKLPKSWLFSESFIKRSFAILGHYICSILMIYGVLVVLAIVAGIFITVWNAILNI